VKAPFAIVIVVANLLWAAGSALAAEPAVSDAAPPSRALLDWYVMGGGLMHGIALCSVLIVGIILERVFALRGAATLPRGLAAEIERALAVGNRSELKRLCEGSRSALARLASRALAPESTPDSIESAGAYEAHRLLRNLPLLAALGNLSTMIGLLGTVLGMIEAFERIALVGSGDARVVAGGIFLALITTAAGLFAAILAVAAHAILSRRAEDTVAELERMTAEISQSAESLPVGARIEFTAAREGRG